MLPFIHLGKSSSCFGNQQQKEKEKSRSETGQTVVGKSAVMLLGTRWYKKFREHNGQNAVADAHLTFNVQPRLQLKLHVPFSLSLLSPPNSITFF